MKGKMDCEGHKKGEMMKIVMTKKGNPIKGKSDEREHGLRGSQEGGNDDDRNDKKGKSDKREIG